MNTAHTFKFVALNAIAPTHQTMRVFANGASAGLLTMRTDTGEAADFERRISLHPRLIYALRQIAELPNARADEAVTIARTALAAAGVTP